jgi:hypothetical protein
VTLHCRPTSISPSPQAVLAPLDHLHAACFTPFFFYCFFFLNLLSSFRKHRLFFFFSFSSLLLRLVTPNITGTEPTSACTCVRRLALRKQDTLHKAYISSKV